MGFQWAVPVIFGIALMLGFPPVQSNAESPACDKIVELIVAGKIPPEAGAKILENLGCNAKILVVFFHDGDNNPIPNTVCTLSDPFSLLDSGITDADGIIIFLVSATIAEVNCTDEFGGNHCSKSAISPGVIFFNMSLLTESVCKGGF